MTLTPRDAPIEEVKEGLSTVLVRDATSTASLGTSCMPYVKPPPAERLRLGRSEPRRGRSWRWWWRRCWRWRRVAVGGMRLNERN